MPPHAVILSAEVVSFQLSFDSLKQSKKNNFKKLLVKPASRRTLNVRLFSFSKVFDNADKYNFTISGSRSSAPCKIRAGGIENRTFCSFLSKHFGECSHHFCCNNLAAYGCGVNIIS